MRGQAARAAGVTVRLGDLLAAVLLAGVLLAAVAFVAAKYSTRRLMRWAERQLGNATGRGPSEIVYALAAFPVRDVLLTAQRAAHGMAATVDMESPLARQWLREVRFDPATLSPTARRALPAARLGVRLGPRAQRPLALDFPVILSGMGWGVAVSDDVRQVLAEAGALTGVAVNSGEGPALPIELETAPRWIWQWGRSSWQAVATAVPAGMIELQVGQASEGGTAVHKSRRHLPRVMRRVGLARGSLRIRAGLPMALADWVRNARACAGGAPVAVKLPASQHVEADLAILAAVGVDVVVLDGAGAGTAGSPAALADNQSIPTPVATARARRWLVRHGLGNAMSLVVSGHVHDAADIAKLLALGADAIAVGTVALVAMSHGQAASPLPEHGPTNLVLAAGSHDGRRFDRDLAAERLTNWLCATRMELAIICQSLGLRSVRDLRPHHLVADTRLCARALGIAWYGEASGRKGGDLAGLAAEVTAASRRTARLWDRLLKRADEARPAARPRRRRVAGVLVGTLRHG